MARAWAAVAAGLLLWAVTDESRFAAAAEVRTLVPAADAYVSSVTPGAGHATARHLLLDAAPTERAFLRFAVSGTAGPVTHAALLLRALRGSPIGFQVRRLGGPTWHQRGLSFRAAPKPLATIASSGPLSAGGWVTLDVTREVRAGGIVAFALTTRSRRRIILASRDAGARSAPRLELVLGAPAGTSNADATAPPDTVVASALTPLLTPAPTAPPEITGPAWQGHTLTAGPGSWTGSDPFDFSYQWQRCDKTGAACTDIAGHTQPSHTLAAADLNHTLRIAVTASNAAGANTTTSDHTATVTIAPKPPAVSAAPKISGDPQANAVLAASAGKWTGAQPMAFDYQWSRCDASAANCAAIPAATSNTYAVTDADVGSALRVAMTATNTAGPATATSKPTTVVQVNSPAQTGLVALWHMDETSGSTMHDSAASHTGSLHRVQPNQPGFAHAAYGFAGSSYVSVPSAGDLNPGTADLSLTVHFQATSVPATPDWDLMRKGVYTTVGGEWKVEYQPSGQASCGFSGSAGSSGLIDGPALNNGQWHTVQCIKTSSAIKLIVDGQTFSKSANIGSIANGDPVLIGAHDPGAEHFQGLLDEASIQIG